MALLLHIDTATEHGSVCLTKDGLLLGLEENNDQKNHGSFLQPAIKKLFTATQQKLVAIDAVAVTIGPGSYTGLRVGLASAKGLCYALNKPLITASTLEVMAVAAIGYINDKETPALFCPMIDARRMEVFTAVYNSLLQPVSPAEAKILQEDSFAGLLAANKICFSGSGHIKFKDICSSPQATFINVQHNATHLATIAKKKFEANDFTSLAYSEPDYLKAFFSPVKA